VSLRVYTGREEPGCCPRQALSRSNYGCLFRVLPEYFAET